MDTATGVKLEAMHEDIKEIKADVKAQNGRVRDIEIWRGQIVGGLKTGLKIFGMLLGMAGIIVAIVKVI